MRILVVSAHFPPNFVSGGTLAPQRQARGLRARGHDVLVYAGWLGSSRPPLAAWDDEDETGLPVHWIVTEPWTGWADRHNFDNPGVVDDFAAVVRAFRPDVVHAHSLQSVGAGVLDEAAAAGAKVVVTMHDFWWVCARQFLVDQAWHPCPLVVDAGMCGCEVSHDWLADRNAWLRARLAGVDLVLAPSASAAAVLRANGVASDRLEVDENGLPDPPTAAQAARAGGSGSPLRLVYTGGSNRMKGVHVALAAAAWISDRDGWRLRAYGIDEYLRERPGAIDGLPVEALPAFDPADLDAVLDDADLLLVPSVMRESHSLITREALGRGVPVVCSDCLGPEEVVRDGENGFVVPSDDPRALALAIERVLDDPDLLARLRQGSGPVPIRSLEEQVDGLEATYRKLVESAPPGPPSRDRAIERDSRAQSSDPGVVRVVRRVVFVVGIDGAPLRYRAWLPAEGLALLGVEADVLHYRDARVATAVTTADAVVVYRVPATPQVLALLDAARRIGTPLFFDVDDLIFDPDLAAEIPALRILQGPEADLWLEGVRRYRTTMEHCDAFIGSTATLCDHATAVTGLPSYRFENGVSAALGRVSAAALARPRSDGPTRIGYFSGTTTHDEDWALVEPVVVDLLRRLPDLRLWVGGHLVTGSALDEFGDRIVRMPFQDWTALPGLLRDLDVNLAPLTPGSRFNEAKSAIKWLEAALVETPTVASPTGPFRDAIEDGRTGYLAGTPAEWERALLALIVDHDRRHLVGSAARRAALLRWSPHLQGRRYLDILQSELPARGPARPWVPVANDEPPVGEIPLQPYPEGVDAVPGADPVGPVAIARRAAQKLRSEGWEETARSAARFAKRRIGPG